METALTVPLFMFLLLGVLQLGLITHARVLAKYAAYRAVRVGAMQHGDRGAMTKAAILHLLPVLANRRGTVAPTTSTGQVLSKFGARVLANEVEVPGAPAVRIAICGPSEPELRGTGPSPLRPADQRSMHGLGSSDEVDFDDPGLAIQSGQSPETGPGVRAFNRTRLRIQLQLLYRMPIPFANWIITQIYLGSTLPSVLMMNDRMLPVLPNLSAQATRVRLAASQRVYVLPINVGYAMRMQSNFFLRRHPLPSRNECIHYGR